MGLLEKLIISEELEEPKTEFYKGIKFIIILFLIGSLLVVPKIGYTQNISDNTIKEQVTSYFKNAEGRKWSGRDIAFSEIFDVVSIEVVDKIVEEKTSTAICSITVRVKKDYLNGVEGAFEHFLGRRHGKVGETKTFNGKFIFKKYEKGWRLTNVK